MAIKDFFKKKEEVVTPTKKVVDKSVKKPKTLSVDDLIAKCNKGVEKEVAPDFHDEAKEIIKLTTEEIRNEFLKYHNENKGNICCLVLDKAKQALVKEGKMESHPDDAFGKPFML
jgi:hypothetical protein